MTRRQTTAPAICGRIRAAREAAGISQIDLSRRIGAHPSEINRWERHHAPNAETLGRIARELSVSVDSLVIGPDGSEVAHG